MKLRLQGNSLRLRLGRSEVARLGEHGSVEESVAFHSGAALTYRVESRPESKPLHAAFEAGTITVHMPTETAQAWAAGDDIGLYAQDGGLKIAIEKDFRCITRVEEEPDAFPHPNQ
jgi:hypothetical protein